MRTTTLLIIAVTLWGALAHLAAQAPTAAPSGKTLAATMEVYAFPKAGQNPEQQSKDEAECYDWAVKNTGTDPFELTKAAEAQKQQAAAAQEQAKQAGKGAGARGAVGGAAAGALIGEIASDDPGEGAAIGAAAGVVAGRRRAKSAQKQATASAEQQSQQAEQGIAQQSEGFKKAFSACLEAKNYMVKF